MTTTETIRRITVQGRTEGVDKAAADLKKLGDAQKGVAQVTDQTSKSQISAENALRKTERALDPLFRATEQYNRSVRDLDRAKSQGLVNEERHSQLLKLANDRYMSASGTAGIYQKSLNGLQTQMVALSAGMGPVGVGLASFGTYGLAAAAGIGAAIAATRMLHDSSDKFANDAIKMREFSATVGLTSIQIQALNDAGAKFAISEDKIGESLQRFSVQMEEFRDGQGKLFDLVQKVDPALARQMAMSRSLAEALDLLGQAYSKAGDSSNAISKAAFGRGGFDVGRLVADVAATAGSVANLTNEFTKSGDAIDKKLIERVAKLKTEIDDMAGDASRNIASIFTESVLQGEHKFYSVWLDITREVKNFSLSDDARLYLQAAIAGALAVPAAVLKAVNPETYRPAPYPDEAGRAKGRFPTAAVDNYPDEGSRARSYPQEPKVSAQFLLSQESARVAALGASATATERLNLKQLELDASLAKGTITQETYNRALAGARQDTQITALSTRISLLGDLASTSDIVLAKQLEINRANQQGAGITRDEAAAIKEKTRLLAEASRLPNQIQFDREQIGRTAGEQQIYATLRAQGIAAESAQGQMYAGQMRINEALRQTSDLGKDALKGFASDLLNGVSAVDAMRNALGRVAQKLMDMAVDNLWSAAFGGAKGAGGGGFNFLSLFGGGGGPGGGVLPGGIPLGMGGIGAAHSGNATIGNPSTYTYQRYVHPAYFDDAPRLHGGGMLGADEEPFIGKKGEVVGWPEQMAEKYGGGGGGDVFHYAPTFNDVTPDLLPKIEARLQMYGQRWKSEMFSEMKKRRSTDPNVYGG